MFDTIAEHYFSFEHTVELVQLGWIMYATQAIHQCNHTGMHIVKKSLQVLTAITCKYSHNTISTAGSLYFYLRAPLKILAIFR